MHHRSFIQFASAAIALGIVGFVTPAQAATFGTEGIQFDKTTRASFTFLNTQGAYTSSLRVVEDLGSGLFRDLGVTLFSETRQSDAGGANDWLGNCGAGRTVSNCTTSFTFEAGVKYAFLLDSGSNGRVFSTSALNTQFGRSQQAKFFDDASSLPTQTGQYEMTSFLRTQPGLSADPYAAPVLIAFDDRGAGNDVDFNDFKVTMSAEAVPEPTALMGLGLVAGTIALRRRKAIAE